MHICVMDCDCNSKRKPTGSALTDYQWIERVEDMARRAGEKGALKRTEPPTSSELESIVRKIIELVDGKTPDTVDGYEWIVQVYLEGLVNGWLTKDAPAGQRVAVKAVRKIAARA
jgi:hypothetical protein